ncbi:hypothetical protein [Photobacterium leiognathi]|uniref:hypothetical protein n=1 Tax=Photobacterium leiognathi TaxID=553611 RepID=UPI002738FD1E|nr:hypothetical protein [Photobacterium leiognathi]
MSKLTVLAIAAVMGNGTSTKSGSPKPYQFANIQYLIPAKGFSNESHNIQRVGKDVLEINIEFNQALFNRLKDVTYPATLELQLEANPENPERNIVVDFESVEAGF